MNDKATNDSLIETSKSLVETNARLIAANDSLIKTNSSLIETNAQLIDTNEVLKSHIAYLVPGVGLKEEGPFISIPFIHSREVLVKVIDELKFRLKGTPFEDQMLLDFNTQLNGFIACWELDFDPHNFATLPKED